MTKRTAESKVMIYGESVVVKRCKPFEDAPWIEYKIDGLLLTTYVHGQPHLYTLREGDMYSLRLWESKKGKEVRFIVETPPESDHDVLLWFFGYDRFMRFHDGETFWLRVVEAQKEDPDVMIRSVEGKDYGLAMKPGQRNTADPVVSYIKRGIKIDDDVVKGVFDAWAYDSFYPWPYVQKILRERLGVTDATLAEIAKKGHFM